METILIVIGIASVMLIYVGLTVAGLKYQGWKEKYKGVVK